MGSTRWKLNTLVVVLAIAAIALALVPAVADPLPGTDEYPDVVFLARNDVPFDAQTAAAVAAQLGAPVFITDSESLSDAAANGISDVNPDVIVVAGGPIAISEAVAKDAARQCDPDCTIDRRAGGVRDETAVALAGIAADYGFDRPVLRGDNQVVGDVHIGGTLHADAITADHDHDGDYLPRDGKAQTRTTVFSRSIFDASGADVTFYRGGGVAVEDGIASALVGGLSLPEGVTIEKIEVMAYDDNGDKNLRVVVTDEFFDATGGADVGTKYTAGTAGFQSVVFDGLAIDSTNSMIVLEIIPQGPDNRWESSSMYVRGVRVTYEVPGR